MRLCRMIMIVGFVASAAVTNLLLLFFLVLNSPLFAEDVLNVKRDKEKTVYSIGQDNRIRQEEAMERDRALDTVKSMSPIIDQRRNPPRPTPVVPVK